MIETRKFGCHCDLDPGMEPDGCVIDTNEHQLCVYANKGMKREDCKYWLPCEQNKEGREIETLRAQIAALESDKAKLMEALEEIAGDHPGHETGFSRQTIAVNALESTKRP